MRAISTVIVLALCLHGGGAAIYVNSRFGFSFSYARGMFTHIREADNGDGVTLSAENPFIECRLYGRYNVSGEKLASMRREILEGVGDATVTRERRGGRWIELSGLRGGRAFYCKRILSGNVVYSMDIHYDKNAAAPGGAVELITGSFRIVPGGG
jgi:hypothetical protein